ncbi:hypothetical protein HCH_07010 [Hahella chejuensis KCTC 2396]|uniref:Uncharacterized protein n=1 Tax=Hahella chejuensis (strain KCTC 2396) TaxID=349521 RepID=Q2S6U9_HAHCH|nr:hypothetical protein HCH_07010 [Hahella chejuensis KCTC 2396]
MIGCRQKIYQLYSSVMCLYHLVEMMPAAAEAVKGTKTVFSTHLMSQE